MNLQKDLKEAVEACKNIPEKQVGNAKRSQSSSWGMQKYLRAAGGECKKISEQQVGDAKRSHNEAGGEWKSIAP